MVGKALMLLSPIMTLGIEMWRPLTTRWNGPGIQRQIQETIRMRVPARGCEVSAPGRSARDRYVAINKTSLILAGFICKGFL